MKRALLILDMQIDLLSPEGRIPVAQYQTGPMLRNVNAAIEHAKGSGVAVAYVVNEYHRFDPSNLFRHGCCIRGRSGTALDPRLSQIEGAPRFSKWLPNAFSSAKLRRWLDTQRVDELAICGVYADQCVLSTVKGARRRGRRTILLEDAIAAANEDRRTKGIRRARDAGAHALATREWIDRIASEAPIFVERQDHVQDR